MSGSKIVSIVVNGTDSTGAVILTVYSKVDPIYAVYRTAERVVVQFADSHSLGAEQRKALSPLNSLRGEINGLIDGWRASDEHDTQVKAVLFDRRVADALITALQGDPVHAQMLLAAIKEDVLEERTSRARVQYLAAAVATALGLIVLFAFMTNRWFLRSVHPFTPEVQSIWLAAGHRSARRLLLNCARDTKPHHAHRPPDLGQHRRCRSEGRDRGDRSGTRRLPAAFGLCHHPSGRRPGFSKCQTMDARCDRRIPGGFL
jgi:hypothetical protein